MAARKPDLSQSWIKLVFFFPKEVNIDKQLLWKMSDLYKDNMPFSMIYGLLVWTLAAVALPWIQWGKCEQAMTIEIIELDLNVIKGKVTIAELCKMW